MAKTYTIIEKTQQQGLSRQGGWWFVLQGKFDEMAPLSFVGKTGTVALKNGNMQEIEVADTQLRNGVLSVKLDGVDGHAIARPALLTIGAP